MKRILFLLILLFALPNIVSAAEYYVDIDSIGGLCSDSNPGTLDQPWCTIGKANSDLQPGDTVHIREGSYAQTINPDNSGSPDNYITYKNYNNEEVIIGPVPGGFGIYLRDKSYINVDGIRTGSMKFWVDLRASPGNTTSHNIIQNCYFDGTKTGGSPWSGITLGSVDSDNRGTIEYNKIINNTFADVECMPDDIIYFIFGDCRYNLIEGNNFDGGPHVTIEMQEMGIGDIEYNIIRNNIIKNELHTCLNIYSGSDWNLVEGNVIRDGGERHYENWCGSKGDRENPRWVQGGLQLEGSYNIFRRNVFFNNGRNAIENYGDHCDSNKFYHNTFYENYRDWDSVTADQVHENMAKNNIFWASRDIIINHDVQNVNRDNSFINNTINGDGILIDWWPFGGNKTISFMETNLPSLWYGNTNADPNFVDPVNRDFRLQSSSSSINSGTWLTVITSADGSGTSFTVEDSTYFTDGWGITEGDVIQLQGDTNSARIININYTTNTITFDTTLNWTNGQGVSLSYIGNSPDIGAYEYDPASPPCTDTCKEHACNLYDDCSSASPAECLEGYCCSGTCETLNDNTPPSIPANLEATPISTTRIDLEWDSSDDPETGVDYYIIYRNGANVNQTNTTSFSDTGLNPNTLYTYEVSAVNEAGTESQKSASVQKSTLPPRTPQTGLCKGLVLLQHYDQQTKYGEDFSHVYDFSGNGNDGTCTGLTCPTFNQNGRFGGAFEYDGADDYFDCGSDESLAFKDEIAMSAWVYSDNYDSHMGILTRHLIFNWFFYVGRRRLILWVRNTAGSLESKGGSSLLNDSTWYHVAAVYDDSEKTVYFYLNGQPDGNGTYSDGMGNTTWYSLSVGKCYYGTGYQWNGMIDEVAIWNRTLSFQEIAGLYNESGPITCQDYCMEADLNCDGSVDIVDLGFLALDFGKTSGFDLRADTDSSSEVDLYDLVFVASRIA